MSTWRKKIENERSKREDGPIIACTLSDDELDFKFDSSWGTPKGKPFTAWSECRVYFPVTYDGAEWVGSAPRDPCDEATDHVGG